MEALPNQTQLVEKFQLSDTSVSKIVIGFSGTNCILFLLIIYEKWICDKSSLKPFLLALSALLFLTLEIAALTVFESDFQSDISDLTANMILAQFHFFSDGVLPCAYLVFHQRHRHFMRKTFLEPVSRWIYEKRTLMRVGVISSAGQEPIDNTAEINSTNFSHFELFI
jgi:hypothetical protein